MKNIIFLSFLIPLILQAQHTETRMALLIGNATYEGKLELKTPQNDVDSIYSLFLELDFEQRNINRLYNLSYQEMEQAIAGFAAQLKTLDEAGKNPIGVVYYSGLCVASPQDSLHLMPLNSNILVSSDIEDNAYPESRLIQHLQDAGNSANVVIVDAAQSNLSKRLYKDAEEEAIDRMPAAYDYKDLFVFHSTNGAFKDQAKGQNGISPIVAGMLKYSQTPGLSIKGIWAAITHDLQDQTREKQISTLYSGSDYRLVFKQGDCYDRSIQLGNQALSASSKLFFYRQAQSCNNTETIRQLIERTEAIEDDGMTDYIEEEIEYPMVFVQGGTFTMGCTRYSDSIYCTDAETPAHQVTLDSFYVGQYEVTQKQWREIMGDDSKHLNGCDDCAVEGVSWRLGAKFIRKLNKRTGKKYRLLTEAEWEFAARGGVEGKNYKYAGSDDINEVAWYKKNSGKTVHIVGLKRPNELGLYDMSGNIRELTNDWADFYTQSPKTNPQGYQPNRSHGDPITRVHRGGSWKTPAWRTAVYSRFFDSVYFRNTGLRLAITL